MLSSTWSGCRLCKTTQVPSKAIGVPIGNTVIVNGTVFLIFEDDVDDGDNDDHHHHHHYHHHYHHHHHHHDHHHHHHQTVSPFLTLNLHYNHH